MQHCPYLQAEKINKVDLEALKYPIGKYQSVEVSNGQFEDWIATIESFPKTLTKLVAGLSYEELELPYRPGSWKIKQVVHHVADSHMNSFIRFKLVLSEENPTIRTYLENEWANTADANNEEIADSLLILEGLHKRWAVLLKNLDIADRKRTFVHPEYNDQHTLEWLLGLSDWHCRHHLSHIEQAIEKQGEFIS